MPKIKSLTKTCDACPSQWEGETMEGKDIYIRFRHGYLRVDIDRVTVFDYTHPTADGFLDTMEMLALVSPVLKIPKNGMIIPDYQED